MSKTGRGHRRRQICRFLCLAHAASKHGFVSSSVIGGSRSKSQMNTAVLVLCSDRHTRSSRDADRGAKSNSCAKTASSLQVSSNTIFRGRTKQVVIFSSTRHYNIIDQFSFSYPKLDPLSSLIFLQLTMQPPPIVCFLTDARNKNHVTTAQHRISLSSG